MALRLVQGDFLGGTVGFSLYYLGELKADAKHKAQETKLPLWRWRQSGEGEVATRVSRLQIGDTTVICAGEIIPVGRVAVSGVAWARTPVAVAHAVDEPCTSGVKVMTGQPVNAATIVLVGTLCLSVTVVTQE